MLHEEDLDAGGGSVFVPTAVARKYPNAARELTGQYRFPSSRLSVDPRDCSHIVEAGDRGTKAPPTFRKRRHGILEGNEGKRRGPRLLAGWPRGCKDGEK